MEKATKESQAPQKSLEDKEFSLVKAKLTGFLEAPQTTFRKYPLSDKTMPARYAQSIAYFKGLKLKQATNLLDGLIAEAPGNPYFRELKAQMFLETGKVHQAKEEYQKALNLMPHSALFQINWAQAALEDSPTQAELKKVVNLLNQAIVKRPSGYAWMLLSRAYSGLGDSAYSNYAAAEYSLSIGALEAARQQAVNAQKQAGNNSKLKLKTNDIISRLNVLLDKKA